MNSAAVAQAAIQDRIQKAICKAEDILIDLAKTAETEEEKDLRSFGASTRRNSSTDSSKKSEKKQKKKKKEKSPSQLVAITPPVRKEEGLEAGITLEFTLNLRKPGGEKKAIDFRLDCIDYKPIRARIDGQWKELRRDKEQLQ